MVDLHFLDLEPLSVDGQAADGRHYLAALLEPQIQITTKRDVVVVRIDVTGKQNGETKRALHQVIDFRDLEIGFTAMSRTVGYTASIGAQLIRTGHTAKRGPVSPVTDVPFEILVRELTKRGVRVTSEIRPVE